MEEEEKLIEEARRSRAETEKLREESKAEEEPWGKPHGDDDDVSDDS